MPNFADRLIEAIREKGNPSCIGLDPHLNDLPPILTSKIFESEGITFQSLANAVYKFNRGIIDSICEIVPAVKPQIAFYEQLGAPGLEAYAKTIEYARGKGLLVIGDIKRSDISSTAKAYANAHLNGLKIQDATFGAPFGADALTLNPYLGEDGISPFLQGCLDSGTGVFILVRTSNPSSEEVQTLELKGGAKLYEHMAKLVEAWGEPFAGQHGYSAVGAVVGATYPEDASRLRQIMPRTIFLIPGYGAQGAKASDVSRCFDAKGGGALIVSARSVLYAYKTSQDPDGLNWQEEARGAALKMRDELRQVIKGFDNSR